MINGSRTINKAKYAKEFILDIGLDELAPKCTKV